MRVKEGAAFQDFLENLKCLLGIFNERWNSFRFERSLEGDTFHGARLSRKPPCVEMSFAEARFGQMPPANKRLPLDRVSEPIRLAFKKNLPSKKDPWGQSPQSHKIIEIHCRPIA